MNAKQRKNLIRILIAAGLLIALNFIDLRGVGRFFLYLVPYLIVGYDILLEALEGIKEREIFNENFLMAVATVGAFCLAVFYNGDYPEEYVLSAGDLLVGMDGEFNIARWKVDGALLNQRVCKIVAKDNTDEEYLRFALSKALKAIEDRTSFATVKHLSAKELNKLEIPVPSYDEQKKIAEILHRLEGIIEARQNELVSLDDLIKARFVELFGDPVLNEKGWETRLFLDMGSCKNGMNFHYDDSGVELNCLGVGDFKDYSVIANTELLPTVSLNEMPSEEYLLRDDDIVFVRSNGNKALVGRSVAVYPGNTPTTFSGFCIRYRKHDDGITIPYLLRVLKADSIRKKMAGRGANIQNLNQQILGTLIIPVPPLDLQKQFADFVEQVDKSKVVIQKALNEVQLLFDSLMQEYFG